MNVVDRGLSFHLICSRLRLAAIQLGSNMSGNGEAPALLLLL